MRWLQSEYILKGVYLGLLLFVALQEAVMPEQPNWAGTMRVTSLSLGGLALALGIAAFQKLREGFQIRGRLAPFLLFLLLESPTLVYAGILLGTAVGAYTLRQSEEDARLLLTLVLAGAALGLVFGVLHQVRQPTTRRGLSLILGIVLVVVALVWFGQMERFGLKFSAPNPLEHAHLAVFSVQLLLGIPIFYLLTFAGSEEESEVEIGAMCAALGLGLGMLTRAMSPSLQSVAFLLPIILYFYYTMRVLPSLRVFKHALRGFSYARVGRFREALLSFQRALHLDPQNHLARDGYWSVHRSLDLKQLVQDPSTLALVDFELCLDRAGSLLLESRPRSADLEEAHRLLDLVQNQRPLLRPAVAYWRAVAATHARQYDRATEELETILDSRHFGADHPLRQAVLLQAWQLALLLHEELRRRIGQPQLAQPGRRMEAIRAVERGLVEQGDDNLAWELKRLLYRDLTETEYEQAALAGERAAADFDYEYVQQLGLTLINDPVQWPRGVMYLRLAAHGLPALGPSLFVQIAQTYEHSGNTQEAWHHYELAKRAGRVVGPKNLADEERHTYFATVKMLGEQALACGDLNVACENYQLYTEYERSGLETLRTLADLHERLGNPLAALRTTEQALIFNAKDKDLLARKEKYYYSVMPDYLRAHPEAIPGGFDVAYCLNQARSLLSAKDLDLDGLDWAQHLVELARVVQPESLAAPFLLARMQLRRGEKDQAVALLEGIYAHKSGKFGKEEDEEAWYLSCRTLGEFYLYDLSKPDLAIPCLQAFRKSAKSGADTMYKLGQAYEQLGDVARAAKCYEQVTAYEEHPLTPDARDALHRLQAG